MNQWWQIWFGHIGDDECNKIIQTAQTLRTQAGRVGHAGQQFVEDKSIRRSTLRWIPRFDPRFSSLFHNMELLFNQANGNAFGFDLTMFREVQFTEYHAEADGAYDWHHDTAWTSTKLHRRKLSMVIQLSDPTDYKGGDFEFSPEDCVKLPKPGKLRIRGTVIVFPSFLRHRVTSVTQGTRYSLVTWHEGPYFR